MNTAENTDVEKERIEIPASRFEFDQYGVNNRYNTERQEREELRIQNDRFNDYTNAWLEIEAKIKDLKQAQKDLDRDYKEQGFAVNKCKKVIKEYMKELKQNPEEKEELAIIREWLIDNSKAMQIIKNLVEYDEVAKLAWDERAEERHQARQNFMKNYFKERRQREEAAGMGWIDFERERIAKLVHLGHKESIPALKEVERQIEIRNERREQGLPPLPEHSQPVYPDQFLAEMRKEVEAREKAEEERFKGYKDPNEWSDLDDDQLRDYLEFAEWRYNKWGGEGYQMYLYEGRKELKKREQLKDYQERKERGKMWKERNLAKLAEQAEKEAKLNKNPKLETIDFDTLDDAEDVETVEYIEPIEPIEVVDVVEVETTEAPKVDNKLESDVVFEDFDPSKVKDTFQEIEEAKRANNDNLRAKIEANKPKKELDWDELGELLGVDMSEPVKEVKKSEPKTIDDILSELE